jgi:hypothetical protein
MIKRSQPSLISRWARIGVLLHAAPAAETPDIERLLLESAREAPANVRVLTIAVSWLVAYGPLVARHRLRRLAATELSGEFQPILGLILDTAVAHGAPRELSIVTELCRVAAPPRPLAAIQRADASLTELAERTASPLARTWGVLVPEILPRAELLRPATWVLANNPGLRDRALRKGDLRCSILESLRIDAGGRAGSEAELARLCGATRAAVRKALDALVREGEVVVHPQASNRRDHAIMVREAA